MKGGLVDAVGLFPDERRLEQHFRATEPFAADRDDVTIGEFIRFLLLAALRRSLFGGNIFKADKCSCYYTNPRFLSEKERGWGGRRGVSAHFSLLPTFPPISLPM